MKEEDKIIERFGRKGPWRVPEGYFEAVRAEVKAKLPDYPEAPGVAKLSLWQRVKPYAYLAAMFAGIWCMMQIFHRVSDGMGTLNIDNPPAQLAALMQDPELNSGDFTDIYISGPSMSDDELIDDVIASYDNMQDFERDFGISLDPKYDNMKL